MEATFLPSEGTSLPGDGEKGNLEGFTPSVLRVEGSILRTLLRADALEGKTDGLKGKIQRTFLPEEGTLLPKEGAMLPGEGEVLSEEGPFLPGVETLL